jgi:hypothetical protein
VAVLADGVGEEVEGGKALFSELQPVLVPGGEVEGVSQRLDI